MPRAVELVDLGGARNRLVILRHRLNLLARESFYLLQES